jgi:predicted hotdog family 3-hydroxylacyl-ACP dehydratase
MTTPDIEQLIPHRLPMRLVEEIVAIDESSVVTSQLVRATWPTAQDGYVRTLVLIELVAQAAGVLQGWKERQHHPSIAGGLLVGVPQASIVSPTVPIGTRLLCTVRLARETLGYQACEGEVRDTDSGLWLRATVQGFRASPSQGPGSTAGRG